MLEPEATCETPGSQQRICSRCQNVEIQEIVIAHKPGVSEHISYHRLNYVNNQATEKIDIICTECGSLIGQEDHLITITVDENDKVTAYTCNICGPLPM